jgi:hypothetical protein
MVTSVQHRRWPCCVYCLGLAVSIFFVLHGHIAFAMRPHPRNERLNGETVKSCKAGNSEFPNAFGNSGVKGFLCHGCNRHSSTSKWLRRRVVLGLVSNMAHPIISCYRPQACSPAYRSLYLQPCVFRSQPPCTAP